MPQSIEGEYNEKLPVLKNGEEGKLQTDSRGRLQITDSVAQKSAFGAQSVAELTPIFQGDFSYNINNKLWVNHSVKGAASVDTNRLKLSTGAAAQQSATIFSKKAIKYHPGQGGLARFTALFTTGVASSQQIIGLGDSGDGYFFGYNGVDFGILRRVGGTPEIRTLTVGTKSTTAEDITITLAGDAVADVTVSDATATDATTTANEIAAHDYSDIGRGWGAHADGDTVIFISFASISQTGTYTLSGATSAAGTFAQTLAGVAPTDNWTTQATWNKDKCDGTEHLPNMDWTKGNVFQIQYQWLGFGRITFSVEDPDDGEYNVVHTINYANANTVPSIYNPTLPLCAMVQNTSNTSDIVMYSSSMGGFVEGKTNGGYIHHSASGDLTGITTTELPILTIHNERVYQSKLNRSEIRLTFADIGVEHTKPMILRFRFNATLTGASFTSIDADDSVIAYDTAATAVSGGDVQLTMSLAKVDSRNMDLVNTSFYIAPGDSLTVTAEATSGTGAEASASVNWEELF